MEIKVPDIGDFSDVPVVSILVSVGDTVAAEDPLIELERAPRAPRLSTLFGWTIRPPTPR